jgi:hypothetical protein
MKHLFYAAALCSSLSCIGAANMEFSLATLESELQKLYADLQQKQQAMGEVEVQLVYKQFVQLFRKAQDVACNNFEEAKKAVAEQLEPFSNIPHDNSQEAYALREALTLIKKALAAVADVTRKNQLPAVDAQMLKKGVDAQATRLKMIEYIESLLK